MTDAQIHRYNNFFYMNWKKAALKPWIRNNNSVPSLETLKRLVVQKQ